MSPCNNQTAVTVPLHLNILLETKTNKTRRVWVILDDTEKTYPVQTKGNKNA